MNFQSRIFRQRIVLVALMAVLVSGASFPQTQPAGSAAPEINRKVGTLTSIAGNILVMKGDEGQEIKAVLQENARILRIAPGEKDLKNAVPITKEELRAGDRILVVIKPEGEDSFLALSLVAIKQSDVAQKQTKEKEDWQKRGIGGIVKSIDASTGDITIAITPFYNVTVKTSKPTVFHRYAPDSIRFSDALPSSFEQVHIGDQLRARGIRSSDQKELVAEEIISGLFRSIAGTVVSADTENQLLTVKDAITKKTLKVKITADSSIQKLSPVTAQRMASLLKAPHAVPQDAALQGSRAGADPAAVPPDVQQMVSRAPAVKLADLQKDSAIIVISTPGNGSEGLAAVTVLSGVERILTAGPTTALLAEWNLNTALTAPTQ
jgi:hypothetical protein